MFRSGLTLAVIVATKAAIKWITTTSNNHFITQLDITRAFFYFRALWSVSPTATSTLRSRTWWGPTTGNLIGQMKPSDRSSRQMKASDWLTVQMEASDWSNALGGGSWSGTWGTRGPRGRCRLGPASRPPPPTPPSTRSTWARYPSALNWLFVRR